MNRLPVIAAAAREGLVQVVAGPEPAPVWSWHSRPERRAAYAVLAVLTAALCALNVTLVHEVPSVPHAAEPAGLLRLLTAFAAVAPLPLAARRPLLAWRAGWVALLLVPLVPAAWWGGWPWGPPQVLALLGAFCLAAIRLRRAALGWMWALSLVPWCGWLLKDIPDLNGPFSATVIFTAAAIAAGSAGSRLRTQRELDAQTGHAQDERARRAVLEERTRIARELHDVVAHHLSLIAVQAETAPYRLGELPEAARGEFGALSAVAREALTEMRRLLGVLRQDEAATRAPQPRLADLPALVEVARRAGVRVDLSVAGGLSAVPPGVGLVAYRIVQESLSNASQHAPGAPVTVRVSRGAAAVQLRVASGPGTPAAGPAGERAGGHGLTGMGERVTLLGGSLSAGPTPAGGFLVSAVLPLGDLGEAG